jgi:hypothetical protein
VLRTGVLTRENCDVRHISASATCYTLLAVLYSSQGPKNKANMATYNVRVNGNESWDDGFPTFEQARSYAILAANLLKDSVLIADDIGTTIAEYQYAPQEMMIIEASGAA